MNDRAINLLEQYEVEVHRSRKGRGAMICDTNKGCLILKEYTGKEERIQLQNQLLTHIQEMGTIKAESIIPTKEGDLFVRDNDGVKYILKTYCEGRECNIYDRAECVQVVKELAILHQSMELPRERVEQIPPFSQQNEYEKHNKELKKVRKYLQQRSQKTEFEIYLLNSFDYFLDQAISVTEEWKQYESVMKNNTDIDEYILFSHGDYQYHNILHCDREWFIINFEKCTRDDPIRDLYLLLRKLLEKSDWSVELGGELLATYEQERPISAISRIDLFYRLSYPEKFWKIVNFYYNSSKAWIPDRNSEKLHKVISQEREKQYFLEQVFQNISLN